MRSGSVRRRSRVITMCADRTSWRGSWRHRPSNGSSGDFGVAWKDPDDRRRERLNSELLAAVMGMDVGTVQRLLSGDGPKPSVNAYCAESKATGLHIATMNADEEMIQALLAAGADPCSRDKKGQLALHLAAWGGNPRVIKLLYQANKSLIDSPVEYPTVQWPHGNSCGWGHDHNAVSNSIDRAQTEEGSTALHIAAMHCQKAILDFLLKKGANVKALNAQGRTPLDVAGEALPIPEPATTYSPYSAPYSAPTVMPTTYATGMGPTPYSAATGPTAYSAAMPYAAPTMYSNAMDSSFLMTKEFFKQPSSIASSARSLVDSKLAPQSVITIERATPPPPQDPMRSSSISLEPEQSKPFHIEPVVPPVGLDAVGPTLNHSVLESVISALMMLGGTMASTEDTQTDSQDPQRQGSKALRTAIINNDKGVMEILLQNGASLTAFGEDGDAPLHFAVRKQKLLPLKVICEWMEDVGTRDLIDIKNKDGMTALHLSVNSEWQAGVDYLLENQASVKEKTDNEGLTVYHMAAKLGNPKLMEELLMVKEWAEVINDKDNQGYTPLVWAVKQSSLDVVEQLIKTSKVDVNVHLHDGSNILHTAVSFSTDKILKFLVHLNSCRHLVNEVAPAGARGMAPIHVAADDGSSEKVRILLDNGANASLHTTHDPLGYATALHLAAKKGFRRTIEVILRSNTNCLQSEDKDGWSPLHTACFYGHGKSAITMVRYGADLTDQIDFHGTAKTALDLMVVNVPRSHELLEELLDEYIQVPDKNDRGFKYFNDPNCKIELNFQILLSSHDTCGRQLLFLNSIANTLDASFRDILLHPLIEVFLHIKWTKMWKFFALLLFVNFVHTSALTAFCVMIFIQHYNNVQWQTILQSTFLVALVPIVIAETLQLLRLERRYWNDYESMIKWVMIFTSGTVGYGSIFAKDIEWIRHFSSFAILSSWIELLFLFSRFRHWGLDVLMFEKVIANVLTVLSKFVFLFFGFMFALMVHFEGERPFSNFWDSFCQVIVMIVELNYGGVFSEESENANAVIGRLVYVCYMLFVALAMINLTVGLAVSDVTDLEKQGRVERLIKRTTFLSFLETLVYDENIVRCFPPRPEKPSRSSFRSVDTILVVYPNKPGVLPIRLKNALLQKIRPQHEPGSLTTEHFDKIINQVKLKVERMSKDIAKLQQDNDLGNHKNH